MNQGTGDTGRAGEDPGARTDYRSADAYIDDLLWQLRVGRRARARIGREVGDHLAELVAEEESRGLTPQAAARRAATRFGAPAELAAEFNRDVAVDGLRRSAWALAVCVGVAFVAAGGVLRGWGSARPWPSESVYYAVPELLVQVAAVCALNGLVLAVVAPWVRGVPLTARPRQLAARSLTAAALALLPVAVVSAGNIGGGSAWVEGAMSAFVALAVPVAGFWSLRAAARTRSLEAASADAESTLDVLVECCLALADRWGWTGRVAALVTRVWARAVDRAPTLMSWFELRRHPWRTAFTVSLAAGVALKAPDLVLKGEVDLLAAAIEAVAVFVCYSLLGGLLGLRRLSVA